MRQRRGVRHAVGAVWLLVTLGCTSVDVVRLSEQTFPSKQSRADVTLLDRDPTCPFIKLAELRVDDSTDSFQSIQEHILDKAATLGADAVMFDKPEKRIAHQVTYQPVYSPWGYSAYAYPGWGYGGGWYGYGGGYYGGGMAVPYDYAVRSLKAVAIRYTDSGATPCRK